MTGDVVTVPVGVTTKVGPLQAVSRALRGSFTTHGRASRSEYWWFALVVSVVLVLVVVVEANAGGKGWISLLLALLVVPASISLTVRRLHDAGYSGAWWFVQFLPFIGAFWLLILVVQPSQRLRNAWGPGPDSHIVET